ncbi:group II intron reverse transcriptase/maturase [Luteimonas huabeiensis]|uniref:group II intron reverse transcriptase/maturase n=1 Tax=Luteimonas huabeiensis TaxID=1244513 RepID=UPI000467D1AD|nr:group II intron reverse transcriptase/maturase [Luteimonas huabeiensis]
MHDADAQARGAGAGSRKQGQYPEGRLDGAEACTAATGQTKAEQPRLMEAVVERSNLWSAYQKVVRNGGAAGADGLPVSELKGWLKVHWPSVRAALLEGRYLPSAVRAVDIPKPSGGVRTLGIPTVLDRLIQQALLQVLQPIFEPTFSESSYGFRPGRSAHQAVLQARQYVQQGRRWVVDIDLEKFFDRVNHDILMSRVARQVDDERVLKLIRRYLETGLMREGVEEARDMGTPQGGPLSPLLSNILLTGWDRELERRGHAFCRYADDCNIYVRSEAAGRELLASMTRFLEERLKLRVNAGKSTCARTRERKFLGYTLIAAGPKAWLRFARQSEQRLRGRIRELMRQGRGRSLAHTVEVLNPVLRGWAGYFRHSRSQKAWEDLDGWLRRRLRCLIWRQAKTRRRREELLRRRGLAAERAWHSARNGQGPWWNAGASHMNAAFPKAWFDVRGLVCMTDYVRLLQRHS